MFCYVGSCLTMVPGIGNFYKCTHPQIKIKYVSHFSFLSAFFHNLFYQICLIQHGDIELNPGLSKKFNPLSCCHWNVNSLTAHRMLKKLSIEAYNSIHDYDFICISETHLDSSVSLDDKDIAIEGYNIVHADHPSNRKKGGVCISYKESLVVQLIININFLNECLLCEVTFDNKKGYITVLYRSPSESSSEFDNFLSDVENMLNVISSFKPDFSIILGNLKLVSAVFYQNYISH